ncbi:Protein C2-DOMAIN ABA-RELATED 11 [Glycine soja]
MGKQLGLLKIIVMQGKRLVIQDFKTSDPYVVLKLGNQTTKTKVINSCLNPVWNEELNFTLTKPLGVLNLREREREREREEVFDKDLLKVDDKMGNTFLNLQPIVSVARLRDILRVSSIETTLRKVIPDGENYLVRERNTNCVNGEVVQNVWLRLRGVKYGELELTIKLVTHLIRVSGKSVRSPLQLVTKFPNHPEIGTLHDNFADGREVYLGLIYPCFLGSRMLGSTAFPCLTSGSSWLRTEDCLVIAYIIPDLLKGTYLGKILPKRIQMSLRINWRHH